MASELLFFSFWIFGISKSVVWKSLEK